MKLLLCLHIEKIHRHVFDKQYKQDYQITILDQPILKYYYFLCWLVPDFRTYLKEKKPIITQLYNDRKLSVIRQLLYIRIEKVNTERYSPKIQF